jgi:hypothetical protein
MIHGLHGGSLIAVLLLGLACDTGRPTAPSVVSPPLATASSPRPAPTPPPLPPGQPAATYIYGGPLDYPVREFTNQSEYLLYASGAFALRYEESWVYLGTYRQEDGTILFRFADDWTWDQGWSCLSDSRPTYGQCPFASGTLEGDLLEVRYGDTMQHSDFENAVYRRRQ